MFGGEAEIIGAWRAGIKPEPLLTVSQWADAHRVLSSKGSAEPGQWRNSRTPYLAEIMDELSPSSPAQRVVFMKGAQVGGTECGNNWIGYIVQHAPGPMLAVQPTVELGKRFSRQRIEPLFQETPILRGLVASARERDSNNTMLSKDFAGGQLVITGANSAVGLRSMSARYLFMDEVDAYPGDVDGEGDPIALAGARSRTFGARKKALLVSTPTIAGQSRIEREYQASDQRRFFVPCPHCGEMQWLRFENLRWDKGQPETAAYHCDGCGAAIPERFKTGMLAGGEWRATAEARNGFTVGFHLSALYSPVGMLSWAEIAADWEAAQGDDQAIKTFKNTVLGETWQERGEAPDWQRLYDRREVWKPGHIPAGGLFCTAGVDVQRDRIEVSVWAWGRDKQSWLIDHRILPGNPFEAAVWRDLRAVLGEQWRHESGAMMGLSMTAVDSGDGTTTAEVYAWVRSAGPGVIAIKGQDALRQAIGLPSKTELRRNGAKLGGLKVWPVGSSYLKGETYGWLKLEQPTEESGEAYPHGFIHLPKHVAGDEFCKQLSAEQLIARATKTGFRRMEWVKQRERNEALDCRVYARAATAAMGMDTWSVGRWDRMADALGAVKVSAPMPAPALPQPAAVSQPAAPVRRGGYFETERQSYF